MLRDVNGVLREDVDRDDLEGALMSRCGHDGAATPGSPTGTSNRNCISETVPPRNSGEPGVHVVPRLRVLTVHMSGTLSSGIDLW